MRKGRPVILDIGTLRDYTHVPGTADGRILQQIAERVESQVERETGLRFTPKTGHEQVLAGGGKYLWPAVGPIQSISKVEREASGTEITSSYYRLVDQRRILRAYGERWSDEKFLVTADVGYEAVSDIPAAILGAMYGLAARMYENRGGVSSESTGEHTMKFLLLPECDEMHTLRGFTMGCKV